jgi:hypothetical protein
MFRADDFVDRCDQCDERASWRCARCDRPSCAAHTPDRHQLCNSCEFEFARRTNDLFDGAPADPDRYRVRRVDRVATRRALVALGIATAIVAGMIGALAIQREYLVPALLIAGIVTAPLALIVTLELACWLWHRGRRALDRRAFVRERR